MAVVEKESSDPSPVLFLNAKGEPMRFFIRPGPTKVQLQPLIVDSGGTVCRTQEPNAILLADPGEIGAMADGAGQFYISAQYILDCVTQNQQLDIKKYRFNNLPPVQTRAASQKQKSTGRLGYSHHDDAAILDFIAKRRHMAKGNRIWQQMEQKHVTSHSWQSMKDRFLKHLQNKLDKSRGKKKVLPFKRSSSSEESPVQSLPQKKRQKTPRRIPSSDSEAQSSTEEPPKSEAELQTSAEKSSSSQHSDSEQVLPQTQSAVAETEAHGDQPNQESSPEKGQQQDEDREQQPGVSTETAGLDKDSTVEEMPDGRNNQQTSPAEIQRKCLTKSATPDMKLSILRRAAREFEESQMDDEAESQEGQSPSRAASVNLSTDDSQITEARQSPAGEQQGNAGHCNADQNAAEVQNRCTQGPVEDEPGPSSGSVPLTSNAHMFIFDQESQEDLTQCSQTEPVSQDLLEAKEHVMKLMQDSKKDLVVVMKALLKASGDVRLARSYLLEGYDAEEQGPIWTKHDNDLLLSAGSSELEQLREKYGEDRVLTRLEFLKAQ